MNNTMDRRKEYIHKLLFRLELWFAPWLITIPLLVAFLLMWDWYTRGFTMNSSLYTGELYLAILILAGNLLFGIPFLKSLLTYKKT